VQQLPAGQPGWIEATVIKNNTGNNNNVAFGFSQTDIDAGASSINYSWQQSQQNAWVYDGVVQKYHALTTPGDILRVERIGTTVVYKINGAVVWTSQSASTTSLIYDNSLFATTAMLLNPKASFAKDSSTVMRTFTYDHASRVTKTYHQVNSNPEVLLTQNNYNELGQLVEKNLHSTDNGSTFKQSVDYRYNIRGWLGSVNNSALSNDAGVTNDDANDLFGIQFGYNNDLGTGNAAQYNGNISAVKWSNYLGQSTIKERGYNFAYDPMNRLLASMHQEKAAAWTLANSYHETNTYDNNGNFLTINRITANGGLLDNMTYDYSNGGNQPVGINDTGDKTKGFIDGNTTGNDFAYDANGNTIIDKNAGITTAITFNYLNLVQKVTNSNTGDYIQNIYDANGRKLSQQVYNSSNVLKKQLDYVGEFIYQGDTLQFINHEEGRVAMKGGSNEYQYFLKDHLGNNRVLFTSQPVNDVNTGTYEPANATTEQSKFLRYDNARKINATIFDHTNGASTGYSERLNGSANEKFGLARSISVMPGDVINAEVYAKYVDPTSSNWTSALSTLMSQIASNTAGVVVDGSSYSSSTSSFPTGFASLQSTTTSGAPKAYLNWLIFDRNYGFITGGFKQISTVAKEAGTDVPHEYIASPSITITQPGYVYIYLSNEETTPVEVYFDDFKVTQAKSPLLEVNDYYGYGALMASSFTREASLFNRFKYNNKEQITDLNLGWLDYGARDRGDFDPRFRTIDPLSEKGRRWSPYAYAFDNPIRYIDPDGMWPEWPTFSDVGKFANGVVNAIVSNNTTITNPSGGSIGVVARGEGGTAYSIGQKVGDAISVLQGVTEVVVGGTTAATGTVGGVVTSPTGVGAVAGAATTVAGVAVAGHGLNVLKNAVTNMQGSGEGRGKNNRQPDPDATGDHTVSNDKGSTTYEKNDKNPSGFQEVKRVDTKGADHNGVPTPHVHEKGIPGGVRPAQPNEIPKTDLSKNKLPNQ
jgi:RHS repeat-associated protein